MVSAGHGHESSKFREDKWTQEWIIECVKKTRKQIIKYKMYNWIKWLMKWNQEALKKMHRKVLKKEYDTKELIIYSWLKEINAGNIKGETYLFKYDFINTTNNFIANAVRHIFMWSVLF